MLVFSFTFCSDKDDDTNTPKPNPDPEEKTENRVTNEWILEEMSDWYYWTEYIPAADKLDFELDPETFFYNHILYDYLDSDGDGKGDRFSWIETYTAAKAEKSAAKSDIGFDFLPVYADNARTKVVLIINYIKPKTQAEKDGLQRGYIINKVDNQAITPNNWFSILYQNKSKYDIEYATNAKNFSNGQFVKKELNVTPNYKDNPVLMDSIYEEFQGHKIGYLVFNTFGTANDINNLDDNKYLINRLARFEAEGITDLVIDLRYNGGGLVRTGVYLGSALVPNRNTKNICQKKRYNKGVQAQLEAMADGDPIKESWLYDRFVNNIVWENTTLNEIPKLGNKINTLCILTTNSTASCSEMIINCLKPYMQKNGKNLFVVGERTVGKNVGSWTIEPENKDIKWKLQPITFQAYNVDNKSEYSQGFTPDVNAADFEMLGTGLLPLGDLNETLLQAATNKITNKTSQRIKTQRIDGFVSLPTSEIEKRKNTSLMVVDHQKVISLKKQIKSLKQAK